MLITEPDQIFTAVAHPARRRIIALLSISHQSVKELTSQFTMSQPAVSQHLRELKQANLVASERVGLEQRYRLTGQPLKIVSDWCNQYRSFFDPSGHAWALTQTPNAAPAKSQKKTSGAHGR